MQSITSSDSIRPILQRLRSFEINGRSKRPKGFHWVDPAADAGVLAAVVAPVAPFDVLGMVALGGTVTGVGFVELMVADTVTGVGLAGRVTGAVVWFTGTVVIFTVVDAVEVAFDAEVVHTEV